MNEKDQQKLYFPVFFPGSKEENLMKENAYYEPALDGLIFFVEQEESGTDQFRAVEASAVGPDKLTRKKLWTAAFSNLFEISDAAWDPEHDYLIIRTLPKQFGAACILHPFLYEYLCESFGDSYIVLPYSIEYVIAMPLLPPDDILESYRKDLQEHPEPYPLSNRIYIVEDGVMTVYPELSNDDFMPMIFETPEEKEKKEKQKQRRKKLYGKRNRHDLS